MRNLGKTSGRKARNVCALSALAAVMALSGRALGQTWNGPGTDWNTAGNWGPATVPNSAGATVTFGGANVGAVNISASVSAGSLLFTNTTGNYNLTSSAGATLSNVQSITEAAGVMGTDMVNIANVAAGSLLFVASGNLTITNNSVAGGLLTVGPNTVIGTPGVAGVVFAGPGTTTFSGSFANTANLDEVEGNVTKSGPGLLNYSGSGANLTNDFILDGGTVDLDYSTNTATKLASGTLELEGGILELTANSGTPVTQPISGGTAVISGQTTVSGLGTGTVTLAAGAMTRSVDATADFAIQASGPTFSVTTSTTNTNGLLGGGPAYATVDGGASWAMASGGIIAPVTAYSSTYTPGANTDVTGYTVIGAGTTTNSLRFNSPDFVDDPINGIPILTLSGTTTLQSGGILVTPSAIGGAQIAGGTLTASGGGELIFSVYGPSLGIFSNLVSSAGLTKTGPGNLILSGANTGLTGPINVNRGGLQVSNVAAVNSASQINFNDERVNTNQQFTVDLGVGTSGTISRPIRISDFGSGAPDDYGTQFSTGSATTSTVTLSGAISSASRLTTPIRFTGSVVDTSGFDLTNNNSFTGNISLYQGFLGINSDSNLGNPANTLFLEVGDNNNGGLIFLNTGVTVVHPVSLLFNTRIVSNGADSNVISSPISGIGGLVKAGTGTLTLTNPGNTFGGGVSVAAGTLSLGSTGSLLAGTNMTVAAGGIFTPGTTTSPLSFGTATLFGGTFRVSSGTGQQYAINQIITGPSGGTIDFTGAGADSIVLAGGGAAITIDGSSTWLSPANNSVIFGNSGQTISVSIPAGVTLTNGLALTSSTSNVFRVSGGGTLFQNSDATNVLNMSAPITVASGTTFRVTDASSNSGVGNFGTGAFTLDGGTFSYGGTSAATSKAISLTSNGGTIQIESPATTLTENGAISAPGALTTTGSGTLVLGGSNNSFASLTISAGTVQAGSDSALGAGPITVNTAGTLLYTGTTSTSRTFNLNSGTLQVSGGATVTLNGAVVNGGFLRGTGIFALTNGTSLTGITTFNSTTISQTGPATMTNFSNGGTVNNNAPLTFNGGTNTSIGIVNVNNALTTQDFLNDGVINVAATGSITNTVSNFGLGGGARMFIGTKANPGGTLNLTGGTTLEVNGALLVNDGTVNGTTDVNFGGQAQGIGTYGTVNVSFGGLYQPGFASSAIPANGSTVSGLAGSGTIDNATAGGNMSLTVTGSSVSTFSGPIQNTTGTLSLTIQGTTSLTLLTTPLPAGGNSTNTYAGGTSIASGGKLTIAATGALPSTGAVLNNGAFIVNANSTSGQISGAGALTIGPNTILSLATSTGASAQTSLILSTGSQLNLNNNAFVIHGGSLGTFNTPGSITNEIAQGRGSNGLWTGAGITSVLAAATPGKTAVGVELNNNGSGGTFFSTFDGQTVTNTDVLIKYTYAGDADLSGTVNAADYILIDNGFNSAGSKTGWHNGDFNYDGAINGDDYTLIDNAFNTQGSTTFASSTAGPTEMIATDTSQIAQLPEPSISLLAFAAVSLMEHRARRSRRRSVHKVL